MARSRAVIAVLAALAGSVAWGWRAGTRVAAEVPATVVSAVDGDTVVARLASGATETVRLLGIDTPETVHPDRGVECYGPEASARTRTALVGRRVVLELDVEDRDAYGRLLAYIRVDGRRVNDDLVRAGFARTLVIEPNTRHARALVTAELEARAAGRGLWSAC
jgi:micrococcal nuclease